MEEEPKEAKKEQIHDIQNKRTDKIINWFKNPYNAILVGILVLAFVLRLYLFIHTQGQTLWWDEAEYMSHAKEIAFNVPYSENPQRPPLFQFLAGILFMIGGGENIIKFLLVMVPSVFLVFTVYLLGKEMFDQKIGLGAAFFAAVSWTFLFWSGRMAPDFASMAFQVLAVFFMWKYWKSKDSNENKKLNMFVIISGVCAALGFYFKVSALLVPIIFIVFILIKDRFAALKNKRYYYFALAFLIVLVPYFIWSQSVFGTPTAFTSGYVEPVAEGTPFGWYNFKFYYSLTENVLFVLFLIGVILGLRFLLYTDLLFKQKEKCLNPYLFSILALLIISAFYIFHIKNCVYIILCP